MLGVALSMLIVFRTNSAHSRFWEARSHWGMIVNTTRNLVRLGAVYAPPADDLARLVSAYVLMLKEQLRDNFDPELIRPLVPEPVRRFSSLGQRLKPEAGEKVERCWRR